MTPVQGLTRAEAWLEAARKLHDNNGPLYNLIVEVEEPRLATVSSRAIEEKVDEFLRQYDCHPIHTVAETIFPAAEYRSGGLEQVYQYPDSVYPHIKKIPANRWGTYALRLVRRQIGDGSFFNPLEAVIEKLRSQLNVNGPKRAIYELDTSLAVAELKFYDFQEDHNNYMGGQCLSHVSLKLGPNHDLYLTAMYRSQYFMQKALGNFKGLARLQDCIARELGIPVGPFVCHATMAKLEVEGNGWNKTHLKEVIQDCEALVAPHQNEAALA